MTPWAAMSRAPWESVIWMIAGRSSGEIPTASASAKSSDSRRGRSRNTFTAKTASTSSATIRSSR